MRNLYRISILLTAFLIPSALYGWTLALLLVTFCCWVYSGDYRNLYTAFKRPQILWPILFYFFIAGGIFFTQHLGDGLSALSTKISFLAFPLIIGTSSIINRQLLDEAGKWFIFSVSFFLSIAILYAVVDFLRTQEYTILINESLYNKFTSFGLTRVYRNWHPTNVALSANLAIAIKLQKYLDSFNQEKRVNIFLTLQVLLLLSVSIFLLSSLNAIGSYFLLLLFFCIKLYQKVSLKQRKTIISFLVSLGIACTLLFYFNPYNSHKIESLKRSAIKVTDDQNERSLLTMRLAKWDSYIDIFKNSPLLGTTIGDIRYVRKDTYSFNGYEDLAKYNYNAHNQYIEVLATFGVIGMCIFLCVMVLPLIQKNRHPVLISFMILISVCFLTESLLDRQQGILFFMFLYSMYTHTNAAKEPTIAP